MIVGHDIECRSGNASMTERARLAQWTWKLFKALRVNFNLLASCGVIESSILANLLRVLKKSPSSKFNIYIGLFQDKYNDGTKIDLDDFMREIVMKYESLVEDRQRNTKSEKDVKIIALTSQIQELNILYAKQSASQERNKW